MSWKKLSNGGKSGNISNYSRTELLNNIDSDIHTIIDKPILLGSIINSPAAMVAISDSNTAMNAITSSGRALEAFLYSQNSSEVIHDSPHFDKLYDLNTTGDANGEYNIYYAPNYIYLHSWVDNSNRSQSTTATIAQNIDITKFRDININWEWDANGGGYASDDPILRRRVYFNDNVVYSDQGTGAENTTDQTNNYKQIDVKDYSGVGDITVESYVRGGTTYNRFGEVKIKLHSLWLG